MKRLTKASFMEEICKYGFVSELIPECFNSDDLSQHWDDLKGDIKSNCPTSPSTISVYKNEQSRRTISMPNPHGFLYFAKYVYDNWDKALELSKSPHSQSPITFMISYDSDENSFFEDHERLNCLSLREACQLKSDFVRNIQERVRHALGYKYKLSLDLTTFFDSIYTHAFVWAVCGKEESKKFFLANKAKNANTEYTVEKPEYYDFANQLDRRMQNLRLNETSGIITGPFTSRIFAEILLANIDREIEKALNTLGIRPTFFRYVDDYSFYFKKLDESERAIIAIESVLEEFRLKINHSKTSITQYPYDILDNMGKRLSSAYRDGTNKSMFNLLNEANLMTQEGKKGAQKYALKMCRNSLIQKEELDLVLSALFNITLTNPSYGRYVLSIIERNQNAIEAHQLTDILNRMLEQQLEIGLAQESAYLLYFARILKTKVSANNILNALQMDCDYVRIIALDLWKNRGGFVKTSPQETRSINTCITNLSQSLKEETMDGDHWLLLYEAYMHELIKDIEISRGKTGSFFAKMAELGISFYKEFAC